MNGPDERRGTSRRRIVYILVPLVVLAVAGAGAAVGYLAFGRDDDNDEPAVVRGGRWIAKTAPEVPVSLPRPAFPTVNIAARTGSLEIPPPPDTSDETWNNLAEKAERDGSVGVIVAFKNPFTPEGLLGRAARFAQRQRIALTRNTILNRLGSGATGIKRFDAVPMVALRATPRAISILRVLPQISVFEDVKVGLPPTAAAPQVAQLKDWWDIEQTRMNVAWNKGFDGRGYTIAVLDTGVAKNHAWLRGKVVNEACFSTGRNCPNRTNRQLGAGAAAPCTFRCGHGTHVAHTAAGKYGVARAASIIAIQVFSRGARNACIQAKYSDGVCPLTDTSDYLLGLQHVYNVRTRYRIAAANLSLGGGRFARHCDNGGWSFQAWAQTLKSYRIATVVSSGNDGFSDGIGSPACNSAAVSVGGTTIANGRDAVWARSNSAAILSLLAPGEYICSAVPNRPNGGECWNGTSMAAPHVAGAYALLRQLSPNATVDPMTNVLANSGTPVLDPRNNVNRTRIDVWGALVRQYNS